MEISSMSRAHTHTQMHNVGGRNTKKRTQKDGQTRRDAETSDNDFFLFRGFSHCCMAYQAPFGVLFILLEFKHTHTYRHESHSLNCICEVRFYDCYRGVECCGESPAPADVVATDCHHRVLSALSHLAPFTPSTSSHAAFTSSQPQCDVRACVWMCQNVDFKLNCFTRLI